ncbi:putative [pyruvate dehydrogenase (acetyl-transferring)] kinase, mitochondrial [Caenorhabditis elegans]|uniref:Probable [pyruvate dehydrogenase (acetyl-transferring)] kinase, mitochondrial n=1 Tax=Caenorhabditis elegans TaxID=6239 RepID=PDHK2_CAEEL|nr:putative [pyruvate dehydrogenase (acetyl-transferring)] kinase, mitochondrial [Caenorhabditis elegans]Q02332.1 RecName: Full=Probable [pyruvate dehydrogenase (acetyl-transferring)] kinase, mitochondrial; Short=Pyruvate dehydrogenase kinase; Flags: Precursor [Caenorhabditis elegans]CCD61725.1 Probable [pyruvate dehydrogenase (acetyl-transferring)] kinase, mitochondrial [Caenorhabditis elegans]|eukprot:NP_498928.1 Probable [pyruvate dehydrogenase (acetyl-transferring)] kinase, mitochondrial [Caenorhabditis elegans]
MRFSRKLLGPFVGSLAKKLDYYSQFQPSSLTIQQYLDFGRIGTSANSYTFLKNELLVRLANIMQEFTLLPPKLLQMPSSKMVSNWYAESFEDLLLFEASDSSPEQVARFNDQLTVVLKRHAHVVETMAEGLIELRESDGVDIASEKGIQYFLDRFYINRISIRMLQNQHLVVFGNVLPESPRHVGCIDPACDVESVVYDAFENARFLCDRYYLTSPSMKLEMHNAVEKGKPISIVAVPSHLYHMMFELFKNAMRATVEYHGVDDDLPDIKVYVVKGQEDLSIKICDRGGGVSRTILERLYNYMYSTAPPPPRDGTQAPLAGYGYGLPLSRLYARYFLGDLFLVSMEGHGTDACIYLKAVPVEASEVLPIYSTSSRRNLTMGPQVADWSHHVPGQGNRPAQS